MHLRLHELAGRLGVALCHRGALLDGDQEAAHGVRMVLEEIVVGDEA